MLIENSFYEKIPLCTIVFVTLSRIFSISEVASKAFMICEGFELYNNTLKTIIFFERERGFDRFI